VDKGSVFRDFVRTFFMIGTYWQLIVYSYQTSKTYSRFSNVNDISVYSD